MVPSLARHTWWRCVAVRGYSASAEVGGPTQAWAPRNEDLNLKVKARPFRRGARWLVAGAGGARGLHADRDAALHERRRLHHAAERGGERWRRPGLPDGHGQGQHGRTALDDVERRRRCCLDVLVYVRCNSIKNR